MDVKVVGLPELEARLNRTIAAIGSMMPEFTSVGKILTEFYATTPFLSQGNIYGEQWEPLSPAYKAWKEKKYPGKGLLVASGNMMNSFKSAPTPVSVTISNDSSVFKYHQLGTEKMPQRVMMLLEDEQRQLVINTIEDGLKARIDMAWGN
jgi:phage gpG-like protein